MTRSLETCGYIDMKTKKQCNAVPTHLCSVEGSEFFCCQEHLAAIPKEARHAVTALQKQ